ncbi:c-type cytochrome [Nisaea sp.]|uniref:c-type cytochrome n=1 Tax=Nisaea sp. TaxID=2024842 RepID=UPI003B51B7FB
MIVGVGVVAFYWQETTNKSALTLDANNAQLVAAGRAIYAENCAVCHGDKLEGQPDWRQRKKDGRLPAPPHDQSGHTWHHSDRVIFELTKFGPGVVVGNGYESDMPGFDELLDDRSIIAVLSYIKSTWPHEIQQRQEQVTRSDKRG